jgi:hypothetical protein
MNRILRLLVTGGLLTAGSIGSATGCADNNSTLFIAGVLYPKAPTCTVTNDPTSEILGSGTLDVAFRTDYQAWLLVGNQFAPRGSKQNLRTETTRIILTGAEVSLAKSSGEAIKGGDFSVYGSGFVDSSLSEEPGFGLFEADLIPSTIGATLAAPLIGTAKINAVVATVKVFGNTLGGQSVESAPLTYPIQVCYGCLVQYPLAALDATNQCLTNSTDAPIPGCRLGQDDYVDCRLCAGSIAYCKAPPGSP